MVMVTDMIDSLQMSELIPSPLRVRLSDATQPLFISDRIATKMKREIAAFFQLGPHPDPLPKEEGAISSSMNRDLSASISHDRKSAACPFSTATTMYE